MKMELKQVIDENEDFVCIIELMNGDMFGEEILGGDKEKSNLFI